MDVTENNSELFTTTEDLNGDTVCFAFEGSILLAIDIVSLLSTAISLAAIFVVIFLIVLFKRWHDLNKRLLLYLCIATVIALVVSMLSRITHPNFCMIGGFASQMGGWVSLMSYICITIALLLTTYFKDYNRRLEIAIILIIFVIPFTFNWIPFIKSSYGKAGILCWIRHYKEVNGTCEKHTFGLVLQLVLWYIPLYLLLTVMILLYVAALAKFYFHRKKWTAFDQNKDNERIYALNYLSSLLAYPLVYFIINIFPLINRLQTLVNPSNPVPALWILANIFYSQQGTGVAIVFLLEHRKKLTITSLRAAAAEWRKETEVTEYPVSEEEEGDEDKLNLPSDYYKLSNEN